MAKITTEEAQQVDRVKDQLLEHFDSVRILVTKHDGPSDTTDAYTVGGGNIYAQQGLVEEWLERQRANVLKDEEPE